MKNEFNENENITLEGVAMSAPQEDKNEVVDSKGKGLAIAGFILSFFFPLAGLVLSAIALGKKDKKSEGRGFAIAGLVLSIVSIVITILVLSLYFSIIIGFFTVALPGMFA